MTIRASDVLSIIQKQGGKIFGCTFVKRTTGEVRRMTCRRFVRRHLKGGTMKFDPRQKSLVVVWDFARQGYRSIPVDAVTEIRAGGEVLRVQ